MMNRKISVVTGSRADYGLLRPVLNEILKNNKLNLYLIVTGTHLSKKHGFTVKEIINDGFKIFSKIDTVPQGNSTYHMAKSLGDGITKFAYLFKQLKPDINLILGDRHEILSAALAAAYMNIPNAHIHGGELSQAGIDEYNRHAITKISNIHFAATKESKKRIIKLGENPKFVFQSGSPGIDEFISGKISTKKLLEKKYDLEFDKNIFLLVYHSVTTEIENAEIEITNILKALIKFKKPIIAISPNSDAGNRIIFTKLQEYSKSYSFIRIYKSIPRSDYLGMLENCSLLIGNSSSGIIEGSYFDLPVVNVGIRQNKREKGNNVINVKNNLSDIILGINRSLNSNKKYRKKNLYGEGKSAKTIVKILKTIPINKELIQKKMAY